MKAVLCKDWGVPSDLTVEELESSAPASGEVWIAVHAAGVNFADNLMIAGDYQFQQSFPFSPGFEVSGVVEAIGGDVSDLQPGNRVAAALPYGGYAEEDVATATSVLPIPDGMDFVTAAAFP